MDNNTIVTIITLVIGFALGQVTDFIKYNARLCRKKKAIKEEIQSALDASTTAINRINMRMEDANFDNSYYLRVMPSDIQMIILDKIYPEFGHYLNKNERSLITTILGHVKQYNGFDASTVGTKIQYGGLLFVAYTQLLFIEKACKIFIEGKGKLDFKPEDIESVNIAISAFKEKNSDKIDPA